MGKWLSTGEVARRLGIHRGTVRQYVKNRILMGRYHSGHWRVLRAHVECIVAGVMMLKNRK